MDLNQIEKTAIKILKQGRKTSDATPKDVGHTLRVRDQALKIADLIDESTDKEIIEAAALLHDIGWSYVDFQDKAWAVGAHAGAGAYKAFQIVLENGATLEQAMKIQKIIQIHDFDVAWEGHPREVQIVIKFMENISPETYCLIAADKGDRFTNIQAYLDLFDPDNTELLIQKLQRLIDLSKIWFKNKKVRQIYQKGIDKIILSKRGQFNS
jgi:hypothetical protein